MHLLLLAMHLLLGMVLVCSGVCCFLLTPSRPHRHLGHDGAVGHDLHGGRDRSPGGGHHELVLHVDLIAALAGLNVAYAGG